MRRLHRYLLKELTVPLLLWVAFLFLLLIVLQFLRSTEVLLGSAVTLWDLVKVIGCIAPHFLMMALPIGFLLAVVLGFSRLAEDRELTSFSALGVSPHQLLAVPVGMALALGVVNLLLVSTLRPWGIAATKRAVAEVIKKNVVGDVKPGQFYEDLSHFTLYAEKVEQKPAVWRNVLVHDDRDPAAPLLVLAPEAKVQPSDGNTVKLSLSRGTAHLSNLETQEYTLMRYRRGDLSVGVDESIGKKTRLGWPKEEQTPWDLFREAKDAEARGDNPRRAWVSLHMQLAQAFTPLAFALLGTPLAMGRSQGGRAKGAVVTLLGYVAYYVLTLFFETLGIKGALPSALSAQAPNLIFAAAGAWLLVLRERGSVG